MTDKMANKLVIIDASACIYTGMGSKRFKERSFYNYPVGGLHYLFRYVSFNIASRNDIVVAFDSRSFRNDLMDGYKAGRTHDKRVHSQLEFAYRFLSEAGVACYKIDTFEADDIVNWAVNQNIEHYYHIEIYSNDKDLLHNIQQKVIFKSIRADVNCITMINFERSIERGKIIPFNTVSAYKVFCGCTSDKIPSMSLECKLHGEQIYKKYLEFLNDRKVPRSYNIITNSKLVNIFASVSGLFTDKERIDVYNRTMLVYPAQCPSDVKISGTNFTTIDRDVMQWLLSLFNDYESLRCLKMEKITLAENDLSIIKNASKQLITGAYEVDRNQRSDLSYLDSFDEESIFLKDV